MHLPAITTFLLYCIDTITCFRVILLVVNQKISRIVIVAVQVFFLVQNNIGGAERSYGNCSLHGTRFSSTTDCAKVPENYMSQQPPCLA